MTDIPANITWSSARSIGAKCSMPLIDGRRKEMIHEVVWMRPGPIEMEVMPDHVHVRLDCDPQFGINRLVRSIKGRSAHVQRLEIPALQSRLPSLERPEP